MDGVPVSDEIDPRIERSRHHVLIATVDLLREVGYSRLTIEAVAARSGVAKSTIYRHWPGKVELVTDAFTTLQRRDAEPPPGPVRDRVTAVLTGMVESITAPAHPRPRACRGHPGAAGPRGRAAGGVSRCRGERGRRRGRRATRGRGR